MIQSNRQPGEPAPLQVLADQGDAFVLDIFGAN